MDCDTWYPPDDWVGTWHGIWHTDCGGKVREFVSQSICDTCGKIWRKAK